jgi:hypothetical protein
MIGIFLKHCGTRCCHLIIHDESSIFNTTDSPSFSWKKAGSEWSKPKSKGKGVMVSEFLCAAHGRLHCVEVVKSSASTLTAFTIKKETKNRRKLKEEERKRIQTNTQSNGCKFSLVITYSKEQGSWIIRSKCLEHKS